MGGWSKLLFNRKVAVFLESLDSSRVVAYSKTSDWINMPAIISTAVTLGYFDTRVWVGFAGILGVTTVLNSAARVRTIHLPNKEALEWKNAHAEWLDGGRAPVHPNVKQSVDFLTPSVE